MNPKPTRSQLPLKQAVQPVARHINPSVTTQVVPDIMSSSVKPAKSSVGLILAIIFASSVISGSLVFFGMQLGNKNSNVDISVEKIEQAFGSFVEKQQQKQQQDQAQSQDDKEKAVAVQGKTSMRPVSKTEDHILGNADAQVTLVEYSDYECPYCKKFDGISKQVVEAYAGKVNLVYRHNPLPFHEPMASKEAMASECAAEFGGNDMFWKYNDAIYEKTQSGGNGLTVDDLYAIAKTVGLNEGGFKTCLDSEKYKSRVQADLDNGELSGVNGTPGSFLVNNKTGDFAFVEGAQPLAAFKFKIDPMLQ